MAITTVQLKKEMVDKVKSIVQLKKPLRDINSNAEAIREVLIDFIKKNKKYLPKKEKSSIESPKEEED